MPFGNLFSSRRRDFQNHLNRRVGSVAADPIAEWEQRNAGAEYRENQRAERRRASRRAARRQAERSQERRNQRIPPFDPNKYRFGLPSSSSEGDDDQERAIKRIWKEEAERARERFRPSRFDDAGPPNAGMPPRAAAPQPAMGQMFDDFDDVASMGYAASLGRTGLPPRDLDPTRQDVADREELMDRFFNDPTGGAGINPYLYQGPYGEAYDMNNPYDTDGFDMFGQPDDGYTFPARGPVGGMGGFTGGPQFCSSGPMGGPPNGGMPYGGMGGMGGCLSGPRMGRPFGPSMRSRRSGMRPRMGRPPMGGSGGPSMGGGFGGPYGYY